MTDMINRVAMAIYKSLYDDRDWNYIEDNPRDLSMVTVDGVIDIKKMAFAAIEAMKEPTEAMADVFADNEIFHGNSTFAEEWAKSITAALNEGKEGE